MIDTILSLTLAAIGLSVIIAVTRASRGPTPFDRVLAVNTIGTLIVLAICVYGFFDGRPEFLDIAVLYALINFIGTIAILKFFRHGTLGDHTIDDHTIGNHAETEEEK
jgi:multicomponent Na+:H+ antiporter subunit F